MRLLNDSVSSFTFVSNLDVSYLDCNDVTQSLDQLTSSAVTSHHKNADKTTSDILRPFVNQNSSTGNSPSARSTQIQDGCHDVIASNAVGDNGAVVEEPLQRETVRGFSAKWLPSALTQDEVFFVDPRKRRRKRLKYSNWLCYCVHLTTFFLIDIY